jgi:hypothetical protein
MFVKFSLDGLGGCCVKSILPISKVLIGVGRLRRGEKRKEEEERSRAGRKTEQGRRKKRGEGGRRELAGGQ